MMPAARADGVIGIFGGTFDPVHIGHLRTAFELRTRFGMDCVHFVPAAVPPHRPQPVAPADLRVAMLEAALADDPFAVVDQRELQRAGPSFTVDTAASLRHDYPQHALCLMLGMDAFLGLPQWHEWERLLTLVNIIVARRPGTQLPQSGVLGELLAVRSIRSPGPDDWDRAGRIVVQDVTQLEIAATDLRASIGAGVPPRFLMPEAVWHIIVTSGCYAGAQ